MLSDLWLNLHKGANVAVPSMIKTDPAYHVHTSQASSRLSAHEKDEPVLESFRRRNEFMFM